MIFYSSSARKERRKVQLSMQHKSYILMWSSLSRKLAKSAGSAIVYSDFRESQEIKNKLEFSCANKLNNTHHVTVKKGLVQTFVKNMEEKLRGNMRQRDTWWAQNKAKQSKTVKFKPLRNQDLKTREEPGIKHVKLLPLNEFKSGFKLLTPVWPCGKQFTVLNLSS